jgi:hypothetical protein
MLMRIFLPWIGLVGLLGFFVGASLFSEPSDCFQYGKTQGSHQTAYPENAAPNIPGSGQHDKTSNEPAKAEHGCKPWWGPEWFLVWVTIGLVTITGTLAIYTGLLWRSTRDLVADAKDTSQRQLRAYVHPDTITLYDGSTLNPPRMNKANFPGVVFVWRNTGETPAKDIVVWSKVAVFAVRNEGKVKAPSSLQKEYPNTLGRGITGNRSLWYRRALAPQQAADIGAGRLGVYFYGRIEYRDIFAKNRWTNFKFVYTGSIFPPVGTGGFNICRSGNNSDDEEE